MTPLPCSPRMTFLMSWFFARGHIIHLLSTIMTEHSDFIRRVVPERGRKGREGQQAWCSGSEIIHTFSKMRKSGSRFSFLLYVTGSQRQSQNISSQQRIDSWFVVEHMAGEKGWLSMNARKHVFGPLCNCTCANATSWLRSAALHHASSAIKAKKTMHMTNPESTNQTGMSLLILQPRKTETAEADLGASERDRLFYGFHCDYDWVL